jgi:hypothetical protein
MTRASLAALILLACPPSLHEIVPEFPATFDVARGCLLISVGMPGGEFLMVEGCGD